MKRLFKRMLTFLLPILLITNYNLVCYAADGTKAPTDKTKVKKIVINEYLGLKELQNKSYKELKDMECDDEYITKIKSFNYADEIRKRSKYDDKTLKNMGYGDERIRELRNFDGAEQQLVALSATCTAYEWVDSYSLGTMPSYLKARFEFTWSEMPFWCNLNDVAAFAWNNGYIISPGNCMLTLRYKDTATGNITYQYMSAFTDSVPGVGCDWKFTEVHSTEFISDYVYYGNGIVYIRSSDAEYDVDFLFKYGHTEASFAPSVSFDGTPSISFNWYVNTEGSSELIKTYN